jgi:hypothetical protein
MNVSWTRHLPACIWHKLEGGHLLQQAISNIGWLHAWIPLHMNVGHMPGVVPNRPLVVCY